MSTHLLSDTAAHPQSACANVAFKHLQRCTSLLNAKWRPTAQLQMTRRSRRDTSTPTAAQSATQPLSITLASALLSSYETLLRADVNPAPGYLTLIEDIIRGRCVQTPLGAPPTIIAGEYVYTPTQPHITASNQTSGIGLQLPITIINMRQTTVSALGGVVSVLPNTVSRHPMNARCPHVRYSSNCRLLLINISNRGRAPVQMRRLCVLVSVCPSSH
jgi:hypothetical protein